MNDPSKQGSSLASTFDLRRNHDNDNNGAGKPDSSVISRSKDHFGAFENENSSPALEGSNSPKSANNKRVKWSGDVSGLGGQQRLGGATDASSKIGKIKSTKGTPEANKYGQRWDFGGAGDTGLRVTHSHKSGGGGGTNMVHRQAASLKSQQSARVPGGSVNSGSHGGRSSHSGSRAGGDAGSAIGGSVGQQASPQQKGGQRLTNNKQPDRRSPGNKPPLIVPPVLQQQRQPQGILSEQVKRGFGR